MSSLQSLNVLLDQATAERDAAIAALQRAHEAVANAQTQADGLQTYRSDYQNRWSQQFGKGAAIEIVMSYRSFNERLDQAIEHQARVLASAHSQAEVAREELQQREMRVASVKKLIERRVAEDRRAAERHDQKQTDESAQRSAWRRASASSMAHPADAHGMF